MTRVGHQSRVGVALLQMFTQQLFVAKRLLITTVSGRARRTGQFVIDRQIVKLQPYSTSESLFAVLAVEGRVFTSLRCDWISAAAVIFGPPFMFFEFVTK